MVSRAAALGLRAALDTTGSGGPGRPTETGRANGQSGHRTQYRGAAPDPGARGRSGQMPARDPAFRDTFFGTRVCAGSSCPCHLFRDRLCRRSRWTIDVRLREFKWLGSSTYESFRMRVVCRRLVVQSRISTHAGAWSLAFDRPRTLRSTPAATSLFAMVSLRRRWSRRMPASRLHASRM
jgi:hypothetical protein